MTDNAIDEVIAVDIWGDYGHFRKPYTTSSPITHTIPPRTALTGLIGAIMGYPPKGDGNYHDVLAPQQAKIAVVPRKHIDTQRVNKNMLKIKGNTARLIKPRDPPEEITRNQVPMEMLRNPRYTLYIWHADSDRFDAIDEQLRQHRSVYTPSLGLSELLADFEYRGRSDVQKTESEGSVDSVVNTEQHQVVFEQNKRYRRENVSLVMNENREVQSYGDIVYAENAGVDAASSRTASPNLEPATVTIEDGTQYVLADSVDDRITFLTG